MKIGQRLILGCLMIMVLIGLIEYICLQQFHKIAEPLNNEIPKSIKVVSEASQLDSMAQFIRYYDEVLTQSARNYAFTGDRKWEQRYREVEPKLNKIIKHAIESGDEREKEFFSSVDKGNRALVQMEHTAPKEAKVKYENTKKFMLKNCPPLKKLFDKENQKARLPRSRE